MVTAFAKIIFNLFYQWSFDRLNIVLFFAIIFRIINLFQANDVARFLYFAWTSFSLPLFLFLCVCVWAFIFEPKRNLHSQWKLVSAKKNAIILNGPYAMWYVVSVRVQPAKHGNEMQKSKHTAGTEKDTHISENKRKTVIIANSRMSFITFMTYWFKSIRLQYERAFGDWTNSQSPHTHTRTHTLRDTFIRKSLQTPFVD